MWNFIFSAGAAAVATMPSECRLVHRREMGTFDWIFQSRPLGSDWSQDYSRYT